MALRPEYSLGHSEFNDFLFAFVGVDKNGIQLTVLSALTRLGLDPWEEAARLSKLTRAAATSAMAATIAALPEGEWSASDSQSIAGQLVDRLPNHVKRPAASPQGPRITPQKPKSKALKWLTWIAFSLAVLVVVLRLYR